MAQMRSGGTTVGDALRGILDAVERRDPEMVASARNSQAWRTAADNTQIEHTDAVYTVPGTQGSEVVVSVDSNIWAAELGLQAELPGNTLSGQDGPFMAAVRREGVVPPDFFQG